jgi:secondary thiamine-phosphate synthase enzyme
MLLSYSLRTGKEGLYDITASVREAIRKSGLGAGLCVVYCPHTTAGLTINENADPDVVRDLLHGLDKAFPDRPEFRHAEGNSAAHLKAGCIGASLTLIVEKGEPVLGTWQGVYFCEFDGPRNRTYHVKTL